MIDPLSVVTGALLAPIDTLNISANGLLKRKSIKDKGGSSKLIMRDNGDVVRRIENENDELILFIGAAFSGIRKIAG